MNYAKWNETIASSTWAQTKTLNGENTAAYLADLFWYYSAIEHDDEDVNNASYGAHFIKEIELCDCRK